MTSEVLCVGVHGENDLAPRSGKASPQRVPLASERPQGSGLGAVQYSNAFRSRYLCGRVADRGDHQQLVEQTDQLKGLEHIEDRPECVADATCGQDGADGAGFAPK
jgi:hypothetical protein